VLMVIDNSVNNSLKFNDIIIFGTTNSAEWLGFVKLNGGFVYARVRGKMAGEEGEHYTIIEPYNIDGVQNPTIKTDKDGNQYSYILTTAIMMAKDKEVKKILKDNPTWAKK